MSSEIFNMPKACHDAGARANAGAGRTGADPPGATAPYRSGQGEGDLGLDLCMKRHVRLAVAAYDDNCRTAPCRVVERCVELGRDLLLGCHLDRVAPRGPARSATSILCGVPNSLSKYASSSSEACGRNEKMPPPPLSMTTSTAGRRLPSAADERRRIVQEGEITEQAHDRTACARRRGGDTERRGRHTVDPVGAPVRAARAAGPNVGPRTIRGRAPASKTT